MHRWEHLKYSRRQNFLFWRTWVMNQTSSTWCLTEIRVSSASDTVLSYRTAPFSLQTASHFVNAAVAIRVAGISYAINSLNDAAWWLAHLFRIQEVSDSMSVPDADNLFCVCLSFPRGTFSPLFVTHNPIHLHPVSNAVKCAVKRTNSVSISHDFHAYYVLILSDPPWYKRTNYAGPHSKFSSVSWYFLLLRSKCYPHQPVFKRPQSVIFIQ
jgi:hypothetical protein